MVQNTESLASLTRQELPVKKVSLEKLLSDSVLNKAELFEEDDRKKIADFVLSTYEEDKQSIRDRINQWENVMRDVKNEMPLKDDIDENKTSENYPLVAISAKRFSAEAYPLLMQNGNIVKAKVIGNDEGEEVEEILPGEKLLGENGKPLEKIPAGKKAAIGARRATFDNFLINNNIKNYEETTDVLLNMLPLFGTFFTKIRFNKFKKKIERECIYPNNVIVNNWSIDDEYSFYSQELTMSYNDVAANINNGVFLDVDLNSVMKENEEDYDNVQSSKETGQQTSIFETSKLFIEQHNWIDLDGDGFLEPYICIVHKNSCQLMGIYSRYGEDSIEMSEDKKVLDIKPDCFFVKYIFEPSYDGSFYGEGFGSLLHKTNMQVNSILNQLIDAGVLSTNSQGFISEQLRIRNGDLNLRIGEFKFINDNTRSLRDGIFPIDFKEPSPTLFTLMQYLVDSSHTLAGFYNINSENLSPNVSPTTVMAFIDQGSRQFKAIYKRIYRSLKKEIGIIEEIIRADPENIFSSMYQKVLDYKEKEAQYISFEGDYNDDTFDIVPVADSEVITSAEKIARSQMLTGLLSDPSFQGLLNPEAILKDTLATMQVPDYEKFIIKPDPNQPSQQEQMMAQQQQLIAMQQQLEQAKLDLEQQRIEVANREATRKEAEGVAKAISMDIDNEKKEAETEKVRAESIKILAETEKIPSEIDVLHKQADQLYEPKDTKPYDSE